MAARLAQQPSAQVVVAIAKLAPPLFHRFAGQLVDTRDDDARRLPFGVGVDRGDLHAGPLRYRTGSYEVRASIWPLVVATGPITRSPRPAGTWLDSLDEHRPATYPILGERDQSARRAVSGSMHAALRAGM